MQRVEKIIIGIFVLVGMLSPQGFIRAASVEAQGQGSASMATLTLADISQLALKNNLDIQIARYNAHIERTKGKGAESVFDTMLNAQGFYLSDQSKTSSTIFGTKSLTNEYSLGLSKKLPTGTSLEVDISDTRISNNSAFTSLNPTHEAIVKFSLHQPIGNNFFGLIDRGQIKITKLDITNSDFQALSRIEQSLAQTQINYWALVLAYQQLKIGRQMLERAEDFYVTSQNKTKMGLIEEAELYAAQANVLKHKANVAALMHNLLIAKNQLLFDLHEENLNMQIVPGDIFNAEDIQINARVSMNEAVRNNRKYLQAKNNLQAKGINLSMKKNSLWPEIDLEVSLADNGLELKQAKAWENVSAENNPEFFLGLSVSMPLENNSAESQKEKAQLEKIIAVIDLKKTEHKIMVDIINAVDSVNNKKEKIKLNQQIAKLQTSKLAFEEARFAAGRSQSDTLIRFQEDLLTAELLLAQSLFEYEQASIELKLLENSLLDSYWQGQL